MSSRSPFRHCLFVRLKTADPGEAERLVDGHELSRSRVVEPRGSPASLLLFVPMCRGLWETSPEHSQTYSASDLCLLEQALSLPWVPPPLHRRARPCWSWRWSWRSWLSVDVSSDEATCGQTLVHKQENPQPVGGVGVSSGTRVDTESQVICAGLRDCTSARVCHSLDFVWLFGGARRVRAAVSASSSPPCSW